MVELGVCTETILTGAGATFPHPLYRSWIESYGGLTGLRITYEPSRSGVGIARLRAREVDFGATDAFLDSADFAAMTDSVLHLPTCVGAVVVTYNLPGNPRLRFTPELICDIFLGRVNRWSHGRVARLNRDIDLPEQDITVVHRSGSSGTTFIFTSYLTKVSARWRKEVGAGKVVRWPVGIGVEGNPGVTEFVRTIPGSIGYVELTYAARNRLPTGSIRNGAGDFIAPTLMSVSAAARTDLPADTRKLLVDTSDPRAYPISAFTYLLFYKEQSYAGRPRRRARHLAELMWWMIHAGQKDAGRLLYAPLPRQAVRRGEAVLRSLTYEGTPVLDETRGSREDGIP